MARDRSFAYEENNLIPGMEKALQDSRQIMATKPPVVVTQNGGL